MLHLLTVLVSRVLGLGPRPKGIQRELGLAEKALLQMNNEGILIISSVIFVDSERALEVRHVRWALRRLMQRHPLLRMRVREHAGVSYWCDMEQEPEPLLYVDQSSDWHTVFSKNCDQQIDFDNGPLWRVTFMPRAECEYYDVSYDHHAAFVFGFSHAIVDGQGKGGHKSETGKKSALAHFMQIYY